MSAARTETARPATNSTPDGREHGREPIAAPSATGALPPFPWGGRRRRDTVAPANALLPYPVAMTIRTRQYLWLRRCPTCRKARLYLATKATCGRRCGVSLSYWRRPDQERRMRAIQKLALQVRLARQQARWAELAATLSPVEAIQRGYRMGYASGHRAAKRGCLPLAVRAKGAA